MPDKVGQDDLSQGDISDAAESLVNSDIQEEYQRRKWKTGVLFGSTGIIIIFYVILIYLVLCRTGTDHWTLGFMAVIPTLLASKLIQLVAPIHQKDKNPADSPWFQLGRELVQAIKDKQ